MDDPTSPEAVPTAVILGIEGGRMQATLIPKGNLYYARNYKIVIAKGIIDTDSPPSAMAEDFVTTFRTKDPKAYDLASNQQFSGGRDIDLYSFTDTNDERDTYAYVLAGNQGWRIIDVTDPTEPEVIHTASPTCNTATDTTCRKTQNEFAYKSVAVHPQESRALMAMTENITYADGNQYGYLRFYDLSSEPGFPPIIGKEKLAEAYSGIPGKVALYSDYAVVNTAGVGVQIINSRQAIKNQTDNKPSDGSSIVGTLDTIGEGYGSPNDLAIFNERSAVFTTNPGWLLAVDLNLPTDQASVDSNAPVSPLVMNAYQKTGYSFTKIGVATNFPYTDSSGMEKSINLAVAGTQQGKIATIDLSTPTNPQILGEAIKEDGSPVIVYVRDISVSKDAGLAYVTTYNSIQIYDIKDPTRPRLLNEITSLADPSGAVDRNGRPVMIPIGETPAIVEKGGWVYLANASKGFRALDLDPVMFKIPKSLLVMANEVTVTPPAGKKVRPVKTYEMSYEVDVFGDPENCKNLTLDYMKNNDVTVSSKIKYIGKITINETNEYDADGDYQLRFWCTDKSSKVESHTTHLAFGQLSVLNPKNGDVMKGAVTDGTSELGIKLSVGKNYDKIDRPVLTIVNADNEKNFVDTGTITAEEIQSLELDLKAGRGTASASYQVPNKYTRYGTAEESSDKKSAERQIRLKINAVSDKLPTITLKRPPLVLIHGIWGSAEETWNDLNLHSSWSGENWYDPIKVDYKDTNADAVSDNSVIIRPIIKRKDDKLLEEGILPGKYDVVVHSMGGLLLRDMCAKNTGFCENKFRKIVTVDTPHKGSKLANMIIDISANDRISDCFNKVLAVVHANGNAIWESGPIINRGDIKGAIKDLAEGSNLLKDLPELPMDWTAVIGTISDDDQFGHTWDISKLWMGIKYYCGKDRSVLLTEKNDKIVSYNSQKGAAANYHEINSVDHSSVIGSDRLKAILLDILEKDGR